MPRAEPTPRLTGRTSRLHRTRETRPALPWPREAEHPPGPARGRAWPAAGCRSLHCDRDRGRARNAGTGAAGRGASSGRRRRSANMSGWCRAPAPATDHAGGGIVEIDRAPPAGRFEAREAGRLTGPAAAEERPECPVDASQRGALDAEVEGAEVGDQRITAQRGEARALVLASNRAALAAPGLDALLEGCVVELPRDRENLTEAAVAGRRDAGTADEGAVQEDGVTCRWCRCRSCHDRNTYC